MAASQSSAPVVVMVVASLVLCCTRLVYYRWLREHIRTPLLSQSRILSLRGSPSLQVGGSSYYCYCRVLRLALAVSLHALCQ